MKKISYSFLFLLFLNLSGNADEYIDSIKTAFSDAGESVSLLGDDSEVAMQNFRRSVPRTIGKAQLITVEGQPFTAAYEVKIEEQPQKAFKAQALGEINESIKEGDLLLLVFFARALEAESGEGIIGARLQSNNPPFATDFKEDDLTVPVGEKWKKFALKGFAKKDHSEGGARLQFIFGEQVQAIELGGVALLNFGASTNMDLFSEKFKEYLGDSSD